jgi:hypothetical protein
MNGSRALWLMALMFRRQNFPDFREKSMSGLSWAHGFATSHCDMIRWIMNVLYWICY